MNLFRNPVVLMALWFCCLADAAVAQSSPPKRPQADRWLLIVDTSSAMKGRAAAILGVVGELVSSGMNGQMQPGAELSVWTYNNELYAGVAPKQLWNPANSNMITRQVLGYLGAQEFQGKGQLPQVLVGLSHAVSVSKRLSVVWISDGSQKVAGTSFDDVLNAAFATNATALANTRMPLVTVLRGYRGALIGQSVSLAPWPVEFPAFPVEPEPTNTVAKAPVTATNKPVEMGKPIFISSPKKPEPSVAPTEPKGSTIKLRPPPDTETTSATVAPAQPMEPVQPLPLATVAPSEPVAAPAPAPVQPAPVTKSAAPTPEPKAVEVAVAPVSVATPAKTADIVPAAAPVLLPTTPKISEPSPTPPTATAALASDTVTARKWPLILGIAFMWVAIIVALVLARRARRANATSLITRSLGR